MNAPAAPLRFAVLGALSSGGMGRVDLVELLDHPGVRAAVKRPHPHLLADPDFTAMFLAEAHLTAALRHPNIAALVAWGEDDEGPYLAAEYVEGASLYELLRRSRAREERIADVLAMFIIARMADALQAAHSLPGPDGLPLGVVHRDISPGNVMIGFDGSVKIIDFGIAKVQIGVFGNRTATGVLKGKVPYMAPEYARGGQLDARADIYSLGVCLFEMIAGERPFVGEHELEMLRSVVEDPPPRLIDRVPGCDPAVSSIVDQLLVKDPQLRPSRAADVSVALDQAIAARGYSPDVIEAELGAFVGRHAPPRKIVRPHDGDDVTVLAQKDASGRISGSKGYIAPPPRTRALSPSSPTPLGIDAVEDATTRDNGGNGISGTRIVGSSSPQPATSTRNVPNWGVERAAVVTDASLATNTANYPPAPPNYAWIAFAGMGLALCGSLLALTVALKSRAAASRPEGHGGEAAVIVNDGGGGATTDAGGAGHDAAVSTARVVPDTAYGGAPAVIAPQPQPQPPRVPPPSGPPATKRPKCTSASFDYPDCLRKH